jgi:predicted metal-binding membrane protein
MSNELRELARVRNSVLLLSAAAWTLLLLDPGGITRVAHCPAMDSGGMPASGSFRMVLAMNPPAFLAASWAVMLAAMMSPVLIAPVCHIRLRSFAYRRARSVAMFATAYSAIWMTLGCVLLAIELAVRMYTPQSNLPLVVVAIIALVWQVSPGKQRCLNACHAHTELAAFGASADFAVLRFGLSHGMWCAASCGALMLLPMLSSRGHLIAMAAVAILIVSERLEPPMTPCWRWRGLGKVTRMALAQARIHLRTARFTPAESRSA